MRGLCLAVLLLAGCPAATPPSPEQAPAAAPVGDLCAHGVLAVACPKCQPALAAVYRAKGDWCVEHGFPESFCPVCHPERKGRPAPRAASKGSGKGPAAAGPADGLPVVLRSPNAARLAGLAVVRVVAEPWTREVVAPVEVHYDATRQAIVSARSAGVLRELRVDVGATVVSGAPLALVESAEVAQGQALLTSARARLSLAEASLKRERGLRAEQLSTVRDVLAAQQEVGAARGEVAAGEAALTIVGAAAAEGGQYLVKAPLGGTVTKRHATVGNRVEAGEALFDLVDASSVWAEVAVPESALGAVATAQPVVLTFDGLGEREWRGAVAWIAPELDATTRTASARVPLPNVDGVLRAHMYGTARIRVTGTTSAIRVPRSAVQDVEGARVVFVRKAADAYELRRIRLDEDGDGAYRIVLDGLAAGEDVVTTGSFLLKTEVLKSRLGAGCCDGD